MKSPISPQIAKSTVFQFFCLIMRKCISKPAFAFLVQHLAHASANADRRDLRFEIRSLKGPFVSCAVCCREIGDRPLDSAAAALSLMIRGRARADGTVPGCYLQLYVYPISRVYRISYTIYIYIILYIY